VIVRKESAKIRASRIVFGVTLAIVLRSVGLAIGLPLNSLVFYSDTVPTADALADTPGAPPSDFYDQIVTVSEAGPEGANSATYTPLLGQPGSSPDHPGLTYLLVGDGAKSQVRTVKVSDSRYPIQAAGVV
jgi:hypothetical protein